METGVRTRKKAVNWMRDMKKDIRNQNKTGRESENFTMKRGITEMVLASDPKNPLRMPFPPPPDFVEGRGEKSQYGNVIRSKL